MAGERWIFTRSQLANTPSRKAGQSSDKELNWRQQAANLIQDMGQKLQVQLCINTAIVFMHRFYMIQSFTRFHRNHMATACLFLAAKVEEQPRKLEHVLKASHSCLRREEPLDIKSNLYLELAQELVVNENILLQTLGFETTVDHPHTHVVRTCTLVRASKDLAQTSYFLATNSLHLTTMCLEHQPTIVAAVCIHLACKWANWEIPKSSEGKEWYWYTDKTITLDLLEELTQDFLAILDKCPSKLKKKLMNAKNVDEGIFAHLASSSKTSQNKSGQHALQHKPGMHRSPAPSTITSSSAASTLPPPASASASSLSRHRGSPASAQRAAHLHGQHPGEGTAVPGKPSAVAPPVSQPQPTQAGASKSDSSLRRVRTEPVLTAREYLDRKERERAERLRIEKERQKLAAERERAKKLEERPRDAVKHRPEQHRQHTNIFEEMREVRKPGEQQLSHPHHRNPEHRLPKDRPHGEHQRPHPQGDGRRLQERPPSLHPHPSKPGSQKPEGSKPGPQPPVLAPTRPPALHPEKQPRLQSPVGKLPPFPLLPEMDLGSSPSSDDGVLTSQVAELIQRSLEDEAGTDNEAKAPPLPLAKKLSPLITVDDVDSGLDGKQNIRPGHSQPAFPTENLPPSSALCLEAASVPSEPVAKGTGELKPEHILIKAKPDLKVQSSIKEAGDLKTEGFEIKGEADSKPESKESSEQQGIKIKLNLKADSSSSRKHEKHHEKERQDRHEKHRHRHKHRHHRHHHDSKERKLKIKPPVPPEGAVTEAPQGTPQPIPKLKVNLKNMTTSSPVLGTSASTSQEAPAELEPGEIQDDDDEEGEYRANESPNPMKLVLSKNRTGHYSSREHKHRHSRHHRHSSSERSDHGSRPRKRAHSPSDSSRHQPTSLPQKMPRAEPVRLANHENGGQSTASGAAQRQALPGAPDLELVGSRLTQVIEMQKEMIAQVETSSPVQ